jgi:hypothetical protein
MVFKRIAENKRPNIKHYGNTLSPQQMLCSGKQNGLKEDLTCQPSSITVGSSRTGSLSPRWHSDKSTEEAWWTLYWISWPLWTIKSLRAICTTTFLNKICSIIVRTTWCDETKRKMWLNAFINNKFLNNNKGKRNIDTFQKKWSQKETTWGAQIGEFLNKV